MNPLIHRQVYDVFIMFYAGMTVMFCYQLLEFYRNKRPMRKIMYGILEILFWLFAALMTSAFLYYCCYGQLSMHIFIALFMGMGLWRFCVSKKFSILITQLYDIIESTIKILK